MNFEFPLYVVHTDEVMEADGILWIEDQVLDDKNMSGETLGKRRLQTPMKSLYPLRYMINDEIELIKHQGKFFIDSKGEFIIYEKTEKVQLKYHKILKVERLRGRSIIKVKDIPFPFDILRPTSSEEKWAGVLYRKGIPWKLYETVKERKNNTWRKI
jgi:hypothetical protein|tara:strand:+ start:121 stop:591 length:471 start_codon:yes stop_codon:yes gene_type:complete